MLNQDMNSQRQKLGGANPNYRRMLCGGADAVGALCPFTLTVSAALAKTLSTKL